MGALTLADNFASTCRQSVLKLHSYIMLLGKLHTTAATQPRGVTVLVLKSQPNPEQFYSAHLERRPTNHMD